MGKRNPVLEKARQEGYKAGFKVGLDHGEKKGVKKAVDFFISKFDGLANVPGVGPVTMKKIQDQLGHEYFQEVRNESQIRET